MTALLWSAVLYLIGGAALLVIVFGLFLVFGERVSDIARRDR